MKPARLAWVLAQAMRRHGNTWTAVGAYHAGPGPHRERYVRRVQRALARLAERPGAVGEQAKAAQAQTERPYDYFERPDGRAFTGTLRVQPDDPALRALVLEHLRFA